MKEKDKLGWVEIVIVMAICITLMTILFSKFTAKKARIKALSAVKTQVK